MEKACKTLFTELLRYALWGTPIKEHIEAISHDQYLCLMRLARQQTVMGLVGQAIIDLSIKLAEDDAMEVLSIIRSVQNRNRKMDEAVVNICKLMDDQGIRILVVKGQTLSVFYPYPEVRQSGDVDFLVHPDDISRAVHYLKNELGLKLSDSGSDKHARFMMDGVKYEIHRMLTNFAYPPSHRYWERVFMKEVWEHPYPVLVNDYPVSTLAPTYNAIFIFEHIIFHLIMDGIGLRQFCDWALFLHHHQSVIDKDILERHLKGIHLLNAYPGLGAILTDYLGLPGEAFPMSINKRDHSRAGALWKNLLEWGNFGHNIRYDTRRGFFHGLEHLKRIFTQSWRFYRYAPLEILWRVPYMLKWWTKRFYRHITSTKSVFQK